MVIIMEIMCLILGYIGVLAVKKRIINANPLALYGSHFGDHGRNADYSAPAG
jgi:hypothetical protein